MGGDGTAAGMQLRPYRLSARVAQVAGRARADVGLGGAGAFSLVAWATGATEQDGSTVQAVPGGAAGRAPGAYADIGRHV